MDVSNVNRGTMGVDKANALTISSDGIIFIDHKVCGSVFRNGIHVDFYQSEVRVAVWQYTRSDMLKESPDVIHLANANPTAFFGDYTNPIMYTPWINGGVSLTKKEFEKMRGRLDCIDVRIDIKNTDGGDMSD